MKHEDNRRILTEFGNGENWKVCKVIEIKKDCILGNHYHKEKDESFMLIKGSGWITINQEEVEMKLYNEYLVLRNYLHEFHLIKGSILIGLCTKEFDPDDEISINTTKDE